MSEGCFIDASEVRMGDTIRMYRPGEDVYEFTVSSLDYWEEWEAWEANGLFINTPTDGTPEVGHLELVVAQPTDNATFVTSPTGGVKGKKTAAFDMIPTDALWELAEQYGKGGQKYPTEDGCPDNWRRGYPWSLSFAAAYRHLTLAMGGEDIDEETGTKHVIAAAWHMFALAHYANDPTMKKYDDRQAILEKGVNDAY